MAFSSDSILVEPCGEVYTMIDEAIEGYAVATIGLEPVRQERADRQLI